MLESLFAVLALVPEVGPWIRDMFFLRTDRQMRVYCRPETSYFLRDPEHGTGLIVLDLVVENRVGRRLWMKGLELNALVDQEWISCERWQGETYAASWATGWKICTADDRIDSRIETHLSLEANSSDWGYSIYRIGEEISDSACLTCRLALTASAGRSVAATTKVPRHINERERTDVKILQSIDVGLNRRFFHYDESSGETITMPRFVYETIMNSNQKDHVRLVKHWELTSNESD